MMNSQVPIQGDLIWIDSEPHAGHEYGGHNLKQKNTFRPMLVMSGVEYNRGTGMIVGFPITTKTFIPEPFQFALHGHEIHGHVILTGMLGYDYIARSGKLAGHASEIELAQAIAATKNIFNL